MNKELKRFMFRIIEWFDALYKKSSLLKFIQDGCLRRKKQKEQGKMQTQQ